MLSTIKTRRSIRKFDGRTISRADLEELLTAGMYAPSAGNEQAWQFVFLDGDMFKNYLSFSKNVPQTAPCGILICRDIGREKYKGMNASVYDCSAAAQNMLLLAHDKGLGAIWTHVFDEAKPKIKELLHLPEGIEPFCCVAVGYAQGSPAETPDRYDVSRVHFNGW